uniref:uncharacterized protein LOC120341618 n=1 Tax=Styela clava TaxID=7725 RepID=UPI001939460B|nr:uncharacterized protein LOC120341618 [Styela clava]
MQGRRFVIHYFVLASTIKCFVCDKYGVCNDGDSVKSKYKLMDCGGVFHGCRKITFRGEVTRTCTALSFNNCTIGKDIETCICDSDGCNSCRNMKSETILVVFITVIAMTAIYQ